MFEMKYFLLLIFYCSCFILLNAKNETVKGYTASIKTYVIPLFTKNSTFDDFNKTMEFFYSLDPMFYDVCLIQLRIPDLCTFWEYPNNTILETFYNNSVVNEESIPFLLDMQTHEIIAHFENSADATTKRLNFIFLSDSFDFSEVQLTTTYHEYEKYFYFAILSVNEKCIQNYYKSPLHCYNIVKDEAIQDVWETIFAFYIYYTFDPVDILHSYYIVSNVSELNNLMNVPRYLQIIDAQYNEPTLFVSSFQVNETYFYESATVIFDISSLEDLSIAIQDSNFVYSTSSTLSTNLTEYYLTQKYSNSENDTEQYNIIITDRFPFWLSELNLAFDSFHRHLDIYFYSNNNSEVESEFLECLSSHINEIIVNDENSTLRLNHFIIIEDDKDAFLNHQFYPTGKFLMPSKSFPFETIKKDQRDSKWWIWLVSFGCGFVIIAIVAGVAFLAWRRRMHRLIEEKYSWALKVGFTPQEAEIITSNGKELFIEEKFIEVNYKNIKGKGSSSIVYSGKLNTVSPLASLKPCLETSSFQNCNVAIKIVNKYGKDDYEQIFREVEAGMKLGWHRHICCLLGWSIHQSTPALIYESIDGEDLYFWLKNSENEMTEKQIAQILWQIADGMEYISLQGIVHKDLAARNIMVTKAFVAKITDFGLASTCDESFTYQAPVQRRLPIRWMAPETMTERIFSEFSDVWSFGVLVWEIFTRGSIPYGNIDGNDILEFLQAGKRLKLPDSLPEEWKKLCQNCWMEKAKERPNFKTIKAKLSILLEKFTSNYGYISVTDG